MKVRILWGIFRLGKGRAMIIAFQFYVKFFLATY